MPGEVPQRMGCPQIDHHSASRDQGPLQAMPEAMEVPSPEADPHPGRRWNPWEIASIHAVDSARSGPLRVR